MLSNEEREEAQILERAVRECGSELELAIQQLQQLHLEAAAPQVMNDEDSNTSDPENLSMNGEGRVDLFVKEMVVATSLDEAKARASRLLDLFEKSITSSCVNKEKEQTITLMKENIILKKAVVIQHKQREKEKRELQELKELVKNLQVKNYALSMHLSQAKGNHVNPITQCFHPDVF